MAPSAIDNPAQVQRRQEVVINPPHLYYPGEAHFERYIAPQPDGYRKAKQQTSAAPTIVIDNGSSATRAGWSFDSAPQFITPPIMARYRDRKLGRTFAFAGSDVYADTTARGHMRNAFEAGSGIVSNWDVMESVLDYMFIKLGIDGQSGGVDVPIVMTEAVANLPYSRKSMTEIIFECYSAPSVAYGIDSLFSYSHNGGKTGLVVSSSYSSTHVIPIYNSKPLLPQATRLNWGSSQCAEYLLKLMRLKYPTFPGRMNSSQAEYLVREHCYVSQNYDKELSKYLDWTGLEDRDHVIQYPYTEEIVIQKSQEELDRAAEKRKESGRRLQEQAAKMRLEKLMVKEQELDYYRDLQGRLAGETKKEIKRLLDAEELRDEAALAKTIKELDASIRKARRKDLGEPEIEEQVEAPDYSLLEIPDEELDEAGIKQKRHQRLMKSNNEARARAKAEKEAEKHRIAEIARLDREKRENNLDGWLEERRSQRAVMVQRLKDRERMKADLGNRKSLASQIRMKSIANLASDEKSKKRRRAPTGGGEGGDDNFGANDDDWGIYRSIAVGEDAGSDDEEEDVGVALKKIEAELLEYDPDFTEEHTLDAQNDWTKSLVHAFLRGPRPFDLGSQAEANQIHLNVERIRVPEVIFQPSISGLDQAGLVDIIADILSHRVAGVSQDPNDFLRDVFMTGGNSLFRGFEERLQNELRAVLPMDAELKLRTANNPVLDAWKGAAKWAGSDKWKQAKITREEYLEKGADYIKEHDLGNAFS